jgi:error-prone DNA polymerase
MGFYAPAQLVRDAQEHGVQVLPVDVGMSDWDSGLEVAGDNARSNLVIPAKAGIQLTASQLDSRLRGNDESIGHPPLALRLGLRRIDGFRETWADAIAAARANAPLTSIEDLAHRAALPPAALRKLADADAFGSLGKGRRDAVWDVRRTPANQLPLFAFADAQELGEEPDPQLPAMPLTEEVIADYQTVRLSLKAHPMQFLRPALTAEGVLTCAETNGADDGRKVRTAGVVLIRQRPGKGNAVFITIEDETGIVNALLWARDMERQRRAVMSARLMLIEGEVQRSKEGVVHLMARRIVDRTAMLDSIADNDGLSPPMAHADEVNRPQPVRGKPTPPRRHRHPRDVRIIPKSRDFH